jgi:hypothetical protein
MKGDRPKTKHSKSLPKAKPRNHERDETNQAPDCELDLSITNG